jgi:chromate transporter
MSDPSPRPNPSVTEIFLGFFTIGVCGFGGVLPWARRTILETRRWLTPAEFTELLGFCQFMPGGNIMNVAVALGSRFRGIPGAIAALIGLMAAPVTIVILLGAVYDQYSEVHQVRHAFAALAAAGAGMLIATSVKIAAPMKGRWIAIGMTALTFAAIALLRLPLVIVMPVMAAASTLVLWTFAR